MRESLSDLAGGPLSDWAWHKASLSSSLGGLSIRSARFHAPAVFISYLAQSDDLVDMIMGRLPAPSIHLADVVSDLTIATEMPDWVSVEDIDVPLRQRPLSWKIDEASYRSLSFIQPLTHALEP